ncbi:MAG: ribbon-helix-helix domain-containing protein [Candidatus Woesearchaeota archaeon]
MESVSIKFQEDILKRMDESIEVHNFNSRTEFIREAVRDKLAGLSQDELMSEFLKFKGKSATKTSDNGNKKTKERISKEFMKELEKRFT